ncbi:GIN domain-containing protein [Lacinutrix sp. 5H-3-7-4]|uniref:GIN domain-containing protein n=1 Tax=Lacinutrix sp. (strain 5H-3-7-4) TaxID=983544 RepID=UPI00020A34D9|nr:DUF2807 domain-containing protein [Lacinutrix sp. 5H-3-7-4]AEH01749.1 hypothetical protein Lacal_1903 [Lacinutrix sp. 5H-3-7-4]
MIKKLQLTIIALLTIFLSFAQDLEKIKGSRNVVTEITELSPFNRLVIGDDFEIKILQGLAPSVQIEADDNLFNAISYEVQNGSLKFTKLQRITSSKRFNITVIVKDSLNAIELKENAQLTSGNTLLLQDFNLITHANSRTYLTFKAKNFNFTHNDKSKAELNVTADAATLNLKESTSLKALINTANTNISMLKNAYAKIEGDTNDLSITTDNSTNLKAENFTSKNCSLITKDKADVYIDVNNALTLEASGSTQTYIYGSPKIELNKFENSAVLRKK